MGAQAHSTLKSKKDHSFHHGKFIQAFFKYKIQNLPIDLRNSPNLMKVFLLIQRFSQDLLEMFFIHDFKKRGCKSDIYFYIQLMKRKHPQDFFKSILFMKSWLSQICIKHIYDFVGQDRLQPYQKEIQEFLKDFRNQNLNFEKNASIFQNLPEFKPEAVKFRLANQQPLAFFKFTCLYINAILEDKQYQPINYNNKTGTIQFNKRVRDDNQLKGKVSEPSLMSLWRYNLFNRLLNGELENEDGTVMTLINCDTIGTIIFSGIQGQENLLAFLLFENIKSIKRTGQNHRIYQQLQSTYFYVNNTYSSQNRLSWGSKQAHWCSIMKKFPIKTSMKIAFLSPDLTLVQNYQTQLQNSFNKDLTSKFDPIVFNNQIDLIRNEQLYKQHFQWKTIQQQVNSILEDRKIAKHNLNLKSLQKKKKIAKKQRIEEDGPQNDPQQQSLKLVLHCWQKVIDKNGSNGNTPLDLSQTLKLLDKINIVELCAAYRIPAVITQQNGEWKASRKFQFISHLEYKQDEDEDPLSNGELLQLFDQNNDEIAMIQILIDERELKIDSQYETDEINFQDTQFHYDTSQQPICYVSCQLAENPIDDYQSKIIANFAVQRDEEMNPYLSQKAQFIRQFEQHTGETSRQDSIDQILLSLHSSDLTNDDIDKPIRMSSTRSDIFMNEQSEDFGIDLISGTKKRKTSSATIIKFSEKDFIDTFNSDQFGRQSNIQ